MHIKIIYTSGGACVHACTNSYLESLQCLLLRDPDIGLLQRHGTEAAIKEEEALCRVYPEEGGHILVVGKGGGETHQTHHFLRGLDLANGACHNGL